MSRKEAPIKTGLSFEQYLEFEQQNSSKHEFVDGQLFMMAGGTDKHNRLAFLLAMELENTAKDCIVYLLDMKVRTPSGQGYYPDVFIACKPEDETYVKRKPCLIIEVLSNSTEAIDRGEKFHHYQSFESLEAYVLVSQEEKRIEIYRRDQAKWLYESKEAGERMSFPCSNLELDLDELYSRV